MDRQIPTDADIAEIAAKVDSATHEVCEVAEQMTLQLSSLKELNADLREELEDLKALRLRHASRRAQDKG